MSDKKIRWALPHEGLVIQSILISQDVPLAHQVNWLLPIGPYWLLYCDPDPVGCIMVSPSMPVGRLEWLVVKKGLRKRQYAMAIKRLCYAGMAMLKQQGSQAVVGYVAHPEASWKRIIEKRGLFPTEDGTLYMGVF